MKIFARESYEENGGTWNMESPGVPTGAPGTSLWRRGSPRRCKPKISNLGFSTFNFEGRSPKNNGKSLKKCPWGGGLNYLIVIRLLFTLYKTRSLKYPFCTSYIKYFLYSLPEFIHRQPPHKYLIKEDCVSV